MSFETCAILVWLTDGFGHQVFAANCASTSTWRWKLRTWYFPPLLLQGIDLIGGCIHAEHIQARGANLVPRGLIWFAPDTATAQRRKNHVVIWGRGLVMFGYPKFSNTFVFVFARGCAFGGVVWQISWCIPTVGTAKCRVGLISWWVFRYMIECESWI